MGSRDVLPDELRSELALVIQDIALTSGSVRRMLEDKQPAEGSLAALHREGDAADSSKYAVILAPLGAMEMHLRATCQLTRAKGLDVAFSAVAVARAALETAGRANWVLCAESREAFLQRRGAMRLGDLQYLKGELNSTRDGTSASVSDVRRRIVDEAGGTIDMTVPHLSTLASNVLATSEDRDRDDWGRSRLLYSEMSGVTHGQSPYLYSMGLSFTGEADAITVGLGAGWAQRILAACFVPSLSVTDRLVRAYDTAAATERWGQSGHRVKERARALSGKIRAIEHAS